MQFISPLVFSCVLLVDPAVTGLISWLIGVEGLPDVFTICGGFIVVLGVALVTVGEHSNSLRSQHEGGKGGKRSSFQMVSLHDDSDDDVWNDSVVDDVDLNDEALF